MREIKWVIVEQKDPKIHRSVECKNSVSTSFLKIYIPDKKIFFSSILEGIAVCYQYP